MLERIVTDKPIEVHVRFRDGHRTHDDVIGVTDDPTNVPEIVEKHIESTMGTAPYIEYKTNHNQVIVDYASYNSHIYCTNLRLQM